MKIVDIKSFVELYNRSELSRLRLTRNGHYHMLCIQLVPESTKIKQQLDVI